MICQIGVYVVVEKPRVKGGKDSGEVSGKVSGEVSGEVSSEVSG